MEYFFNIFYNPQRLIVPVAEGFSFYRYPAVKAPPCGRCASHKLLRFTEQYKKLSAGGFGTEEKNVVFNIKHYEAAIKALEEFLKQTAGDE
jgi:hypothetical protein